MNIQAMAEEVEKLSGELTAFYEKNKDNFTTEVVTEFNNRNTELGEKVKAFTEARKIESEAKKAAELFAQMRKPADGIELPAPGGPQSKDREVGFKTLGDHFMESGALKNKSQWQQAKGVDFKTLMQTTAGFAPETTRNRPLVPYALRPLNLLELIPTRPLSQVAVTYMEETTFTNGAVGTSEGGTYGEAALVFTEQTSNVRKIAVWLPVTDEQLTDVDYMRSLIDDRLAMMLRHKLEALIVGGDGVAPNLLGIVNISGIQTQALGADSRLDAFLRAHVKLEINPFTYPTVDLLHPSDWQDIRLAKDSAGRYLMGDPHLPGPMTFFGIPVEKSTALTAGTGIVQDTTALELGIYRDIDVIAGYVNDDLIKGKQAIRADVRAAFLSYRPTATCTVTGI